MEQLSRLGLFTRFPQYYGLDWIMDVLRPHLECQKSSAMILCGKHGIGKSALSYYVYKSLLRKHRSSDMIITYFSFDARDHRRRSVTSMLSNIICQILANEPDLFFQTTEPPQKDDLRWTEGNMWIQLRSIVRRVKGKSLVLVVDSVHDCDTYDPEELLRNLVNLEFARPEGFKLLCTTGIGLITPGIDPVTTFTIDTLSQFKQSWNVYIGSLAKDVISESPRFTAVHDSVTECLTRSEGFLHSTLVAHRIRTITSLSRPSNIKADLSQLKLNLKDTVLGMVKESPPWVASAVSWIMFANRPLKPLELAVAVALEESTPSPSPIQTIDELWIPRDMAGDLKRQLGPLVNVEDEEIRISHPYAGRVLQEWVNSTPEATRLSYKTLTRLCLEYIHLCLKQKSGKETTIPNEISFQFLEYILEHWHMHYREAKADSANAAVDDEIDDLVYSLFTTPSYFSWLRPLGSLSSSISSVDDDILCPLHLAAQLGVLDVVKRMIPEPDNDSITTLQIACRYCHLDIVVHLVQGIDEASKVEMELDLACLRGDAAILNALLKRLKQLSPETKAPAYILINACKIGHRAIAKSLVEAGANVKGAEGPLALEQAVDQGHLDVVDFLLKQEVDVNVVSSDKSSPLHRSIRRGYSHISDRLLEVGGIRDLADADGITALHLAARSGDVTLVKKIINLPRQIPEYSKTVSSPLHEAATGGHLEVIRILLDKGMPIDSPDSNGRTALFLALSKNHVEVISELFSRGAVITFGNDYSASALKQAVVHGNLDATKKLIARGADVGGGEGRTGTPLTDAAIRNFADITRQLIAAGVDLDKKVDYEFDLDIMDEPAHLGWTAVHFAAYHGSAATMELFGELYHDNINMVSVSGHTPLHLAAFANKQGIVELILGNKPSIESQTPVLGGNERSITATTIPRREMKTILDVDPRSPKGRTPLHIAAMNGKLDIVQALLESGADINACDDAGMAPIHYGVASAQDSKEVVECLISNGAVLDWADKDGWTALSHAAQAGNVNVAFLLLQNGCNANAATMAARTPLHIAALNGSSKIIRYLLDYGADPNTTDQGGYSALHSACYNGSKDVVRLLLKRKAEVNAADSQGNRPLHEAARRGHTAVVERLLVAGADVNVTNGRKMTPLQRSILNRWFLTATSLLSWGANPNIRDEDGDTALTVAMMSSASDKFVETLLNHTANPDTMNNRHQTALMAAATRAPRHIPILLQSGANMFESGPGKITVLHIVASITSATKIDSIIPLLKDNNQLDIKDAEGLAPIHHAAKAPSAGMIKAFRKYGANIGERDSQGRTAMHHAVRSMPFNDFKEVFADFLRPGSENSVNVSDGDGWTPLHWACKGAGREVVQLLLLSRNNRDQIYAKCNRGWTPYDIAVFHDQEDLKKIMETALDTQLDASPGQTVATPASESRRTGLIAHGEVHEGVVCDDCLYRPLYGIRFKCNTHPDFDLCFKCRWSSDKTHQPSHGFRPMGSGPTEGPDFQNHAPVWSHDEKRRSTDQTVTRHRASPLLIERDRHAHRANTSRSRRERVRLLSASPGVTDREGSIRREIEMLEREREMMNLRSITRPENEAREAIRRVEMDRATEARVLEHMTSREMDILREVAIQRRRDSDNDRDGVRARLERDASMAGGTIRIQRLDERYSQEESSRSLLLPRREYDRSRTERRLYRGDGYLIPNRELGSDDD
ncbi:ankyrin repeat-containing domain protein [Truncatella angustata]|uniref:Ankyrin repeat-containing domain protein n=1 Tax=Truncatella angustata TaxID=152316 RepID=A0A9P8UJR8_9PEZI|nr:ankyrin repeat-containing domain protein [Truncatella angustata]KAH6653770.1 ankyrin repeat-containing domain protein [Truncatella angustata]